MGFERRERDAMKHLLRGLITLLAITGLAYPSIASRQVRGRSSGFSRGHSQSPVVCDGAEEKLLALCDRGQDDTPAAVSTKRIEGPSSTEVFVLNPTAELHALQKQKRAALGRSPPLVILHSQPMPV